MSDPTHYAIKNWTQFQHYHTRNAPWIKLYVALLDDADFLALSEVAQAQLVKLWALAARMNNQLPTDAHLLGGKIGTRKLRLQELVASGFLLAQNANDASNPASKMLANALAQNANRASTDASKMLASHARGRAVAERERERRETTPPVGPPLLSAPTEPVADHNAASLDKLASYPDLAAHLEPDVQTLVDTYTRTARLPVAVLASLQSLHDRDGFAWPVINAALRDYATTDSTGRLNPNALRAFCRSGTRGESATAAFLRGAP